MQLLHRNSAFKIDDLWPISTVKANTLQFKPGSQEKTVNSLISPGCVIDGYVENSILSPGVWVEKKARVVNSIVMANTRIGYHSIVDRCILDEAVNIDRFCYLGFGAASVAKSSDITLVGKEVNLGPQIAIGRKSKIMPGLRIADLRSQFVAPGTVLSVPA
jgi:glucose-1-phosphate adenylyltransferase